MTTVSSGTQSNLIVTPANAVTVTLSGNTTSTTVSSGGTLTVISGGTDSNSTVYLGGVVSVGKSGTENNVTVSGGEVIVTGGSAIVDNATVYAGGTIVLASTSATVEGKLVFSGAGTLLAEGNAVSVVSGGFVSNSTGDEAVISGFGAGDLIDITSATAVAVSGMTGVGLTTSALTSGTFSGDTLATVSGHGSSLYYIFAGGSIGAQLQLEAVSGGIAIEYSSVAHEYVTSGVTSSGLTVSSAAILEVSSGGTVSGTTILSGGSAIIDAGGTGVGSFIANGGVETVFGAEPGSTISGTQIVSGASATIANETVGAGGVVDLDQLQSAATGLVVSGGTLVLSGGAAAAGVSVENGGTIELLSPNATLSGSVFMSGAAAGSVGTNALAGDGRIVVGTNPVAGAGVQAVISGFGANDAIDLTSANTLGADLAAGTARLSTVTSGGDTIATVTSGTASESFTLAGSVVVTPITDGAGGIDLVSLPTITAFTPGDLVISISGDVSGGNAYGDNGATPMVLEELTTTGSIVGIMVMPQTTTVVNGVTEYAISSEFGSQSEGLLQLSGDGQSLTIMGYGVNAQLFNAGGAPVYGTAALAQSISVPDSGYTTVPRVIADISYNGTVDTSTALYDVFSTNNPRSVYTINGSTFWVSGQGAKGTATQGVFYTQDGANSATPIDTSSDTRFVSIVNGQLYVSRDSTQVGGGSITVYGTTVPTGTAVGTALSGIGPSTVIANNGDGINSNGQTVYLSPESYFFASSTVLYIADGGQPKDDGDPGTGADDGGLQKWVLNTTTGTWSLAYTLAAGLNLVSNTATDGTTGLIGLTGTVNAGAGTVTFYATNYIASDFDQTNLYTITDTLSDTTAAQASGESFTTLLSGVPASYNIRGISFAPVQASETAAAIVVSGGVTSSGVTVTSGGSITILNGGTAVATTIEAGGSETVSSGGIASGSDIVNGATDLVYGAASGGDLGGAQTVGGGQISDETVLNGGVATVSGGIANGTTMESGGTLVLEGGSTASNTVIEGGVADLTTAADALTGTLTFNALGGTVDVAAVPAVGAGVQAVVAAWGAGDVIDFQAVGSGATLSTATVSGDTVATISSGGISTSVTFSGAGVSEVLELVPDGGTGMELAYNAPPVITVSSGVTSSGLSLYYDTVNVLSGGTLSAASVYSGGSAVIEYGGTDENSTVYAGGIENLEGNATGDQIYGTQVLSQVSSATVSNETVYTGGAIDLYLAGTTGTNLTAASGGQLNISGRGTIDNAILNGGTLQLESPKATLSGGLTFEAPSELIYTARNSQTSAGLLFGDQAIISGFTGGDIIDLTSGAAIGAGAVLTTVFSGGVTTATISGDGGIPQVFYFNGDEGLEMISDGNGGVEIVTCYGRGTRIATPDGDVAIEALREGDRVLTADGGTAPVKWIGYRSLDCTRHPAPEKAWPVRVCAGAFGEGLPKRDLILSPQHAIFSHGVLVPVKHLINGRTIVREVVASIEYFHVELDRHDIILAEGLPAESYLDTGDRGSFQNAGVPVVLHPDMAAITWEAMGAAELKVIGPEVDAIRALLAARAGAASVRAA